MISVSMSDQLAASDSDQCVNMSDDQLNTVLAFTVASSVRYTGPQGPVRVPLYSERKSSESLSTSDALRFGSG